MSIVGNQSMQFRVLVVGASPDQLNSNTHIRSYVVNGFKSYLGRDFAREVSLEHAENAIRSWTPNIVVIFGSCMPDVSGYLGIKKLCKSLEVPIAFWLHDDPYEFDYSPKVERIADWIFSNDRWASMHYNSDNVFHLPLAGCPETHFRDWSSQKKHQIFFCGVAFPNRIQLISDLSGILSKHTTYICGRGWPQENEYIQNKILSNKEVTDLVSSSTVTINIGRNFNLANNRFQLDPSTPGPRTFEAAMSGSVQLYFSDSLEIADYFTPNKEILLFDSPNSFKLHIEKMLDQPEEAKNIALTAQKRALNEHTYENRCRQLLEKCQLDVNIIRSH